MTVTTPTRTSTAYDTNNPMVLDRPRTPQKPLQTPNHQIILSYASAPENRGYPAHSRPVPSRTG